MLTQDQLTTIRAALRFWCDEMTPAGSDVAAAYYDASVENHLRAVEIELLIDQLQPEKIRYALITPTDFVLAVTAKPSISRGPNRNATLIYGPKSTPSS
ncbi:hypothetical protein [Rhodopirellula europaea]|uniref:hypothetical protein n=1 Tax=Rhodopirellula europaea TaxID=1263866 RepID=UPI003D2B8E4A